MSVEQQAGLLLVCMHVQQFQIAADAARLVLQRRRRRRVQRRRMFWVRPWLEAARRFQHGHYHRLMTELRLEDPCSYFNYLRVPLTLFDELLDRLRPRNKMTTRYRKALEPGLKLAMTLRHLASGDRYASMKFEFRVPHNTMSLCVREVCQAIIDEFKDECIQCPTTEEEWRAISAEFERRWNVPHACGALDGKHIACRLSSKQLDFISVLPTSRQSSARTPWKRGANAVEARCERQERRANAVKNVVQAPWNAT